MFIGRQAELAQLDAITKKKTANLVVIKGRRRIGKSRLVDEFAKRQTCYAYYKFIGLPPVKVSEKEQLEEFSQQFARNFQKIGLYFKEWGDAFFHLAKECQDKKVILLFDEISWMGSADKNFTGKLKTAWDLYFQKNPNLILILCGSVSSWIEENIINNTGFVGRISHQFQLNELPLSDCNQFWGKQSKTIAPYEKLKLLSVTGGIPRYLEEIAPNEPSEKNINRLCYRADGLLFNEFDQIFYTSLGAKSENYHKIIMALKDQPLERAALCQKIGLPNNSYATNYIQNLVSAGFIKRYNTWDIYKKKKSNLSQLRIKDNYIRFYLKSILPHKDMVMDSGMNAQFDITKKGNWLSTLGYQFENLVINNYQKIWDILGIDINDILFHGPYFQKHGAIQKGCQIDYLIQTVNNQLYICEIKFSKNAISRDIIPEIDAKIDALGPLKKISYWPVLIHMNGVTESLEGENYFSHMIDFGDLLG